MNAEQLQQLIVDGIAEFLDRAQLRLEAAPEALPFKPAQGYVVTNWMRARLRDEVGTRFHLLKKP